MTKQISLIRGIRIAWLVMMIAIFLFWISVRFDVLALVYGADGNDELHLLMLFILLILTFPLGLLWLMLLNAVGYMFAFLGNHIEITDLILVPFVWLGFVAIGYGQWFKLVPWLWRSWKKP